jgi:C-terminal processing protease CtpA/Prc
MGILSNCPIIRSKPKFNRTEKHTPGMLQIAAVALLNLLFSISLPLPLSASPQQAGFDRKAWVEDYNELKTALEQRYSNLAWFASPQGGIDLPALNKHTLDALRRAKSDADARSAIMAFADAFHGHFSRLSDLEPATQTKTPEPPPYAYAREAPEAGCAALGFAAWGTTSFSLPFESLPNFRLIADGQEQPIRAGIVTLENHTQIGMMRLAEFQTKLYPALCARAWKAEVWNDHNQLRQGKFEDTVEKEWYETIAELLNQFKAAGVAAVVVDIGRNGGGDDSGDMAARLFTSHPLKSAPMLMSQEKSASNPYFEEQLEEMKQAAKYKPNDNAKALIDERTTFFTEGQKKLSISCPMDWVWKQRVDWQNQGCKRLLSAGSAGGPLDYLKPGEVEDVRIARRLHWPAKYTQLWGTWTGPVYVLTDGRTYSSAEMFAAVLQDNHAAKIVGSQTGGSGCGFAEDPPELTLTHSRLRFRMPNCVRLRADGTDEVAGVRPDIQVLATEGESSRGRAWRVAQMVDADLRSTH